MTTPRVLPVHDVHLAVMRFDADRCHYLAVSGLGTRSAEVHRHRDRWFRQGHGTRIGVLTDGGQYGLFGRIETGNSGMLQNEGAESLSKVARRRSGILTENPTNRLTKPCQATTIRT